MLLEDYPERIFGEENVDIDCVKDQSSLLWKLSCITAEQTSGDGFRAARAKDATVAAGAAAGASGELPGTVDFLPKCVVVTGFHHSGTTLLRHMIGSHPDAVEIMREMWPTHSYVQFLANKYMRGGASGTRRLRYRHHHRHRHRHRQRRHLLQEVQPPAAAAAAAAVGLRSGQQEKFQVFKNTVNSQMKMEQLERLLSTNDRCELFVVALIRDPRDTAWSVLQRFPEKNLSTNIEFGHDTISKLVQLSGQNQNMLVVRYEDLIRDPTRELTRVAETAKFDFDEEMLRYDDHTVYQDNTGRFKLYFLPYFSNIHGATRVAQINKPLSPDRVSAWRQEAPEETVQKVLQQYPDSRYDSLLKDVVIVRGR